MATQPDGKLAQIGDCGSVPAGRSTATTTTWG